jgi:hypothetical protein
VCGCGLMMMTMMTMMMMMVCKFHRTTATEKTMYTPSVQCT